MWYTVNVPWSVLHSAAVECHEVKLLHFLSAVWRFCGISFKFSKVVHLKTIPIPTNSIGYAQLQVRDAKKNDIAGVNFQKICFLLKNFLTHHLIKCFWMLLWILGSPFTYSRIIKEVLGYFDIFLFYSDIQDKKDLLLHHYFPCFPNFYLFVTDLKSFRENDLLTRKLEKIVRYDSKWPGFMNYLQWV